jgi:GT2 family glycosyltransferase
VKREEKRRPPAGKRLVSILTPVKDPPLEVWRETVRSVLAQSGRFEWCLADDGSRPEVRRELESLAARDRRVKLAKLDASRGIAAATNAALALAKGELVAFLDHDDTLDRDAVSWIEAAFEDPVVGAAYSDEDKLDGRGKRFAPFLKPAFSDDLLVAFNYVCHFFCVRHDLLRALGGLREGFDGSQDLDLALRVAERARIAHVPRVLYHWRAVAGSAASSARAKPWAREATRRALESALERRGERGGVVSGSWEGSFVVERPLREDALARVSFFVAPGLEPGAHALERLAAHALRRDVAVVTPLVLARKKIESAGLALGFGKGVAACPFRGRHEDDPGYFGLARSTRDVSAAPGDAFAIETRKLEALGGFPTDVDPVHAGIALALRARATGLRTIYASEAVFRRRSGSALAETKTAVAKARSVLGPALGDEPNVSPHFSRGKERLELPRR